MYTYMTPMTWSNELRAQLRARAEAWAAPWDPDCRHQELLVAVRERGDAPEARYPVPRRSRRWQHKRGTHEPNSIHHPGPRMNLLDVPLTDPVDQLPRSSALQQQAKDSNGVDLLGHEVRADRNGESLSGLVERVVD